MKPSSSSVANEFGCIRTESEISKLTDLNISVTSACEFMSETNMIPIGSDRAVSSQFNEFKVTESDLVEKVNQRKSSLVKLRVAPLNIQKINKESTNKSHLEQSVYGTPKTQTVYADSANANFPLAQKLAGIAVFPITPPNDDVSDKITHRRSRNRYSPNEKSYTSTKKLVQTQSLQPHQLPATPQSGRFWSSENETESFGSLSSPPSLSYSIRLSGSESIKAMERMRRRHNCVRELYNTEWMFAQDMAVIVRIYMCGSANLGLSMRQIDTLFSNVTHIMDVSLSLVAILESQIPAQILGGSGPLSPLDVAADEELRVGQAMCMALTGQLYEIYESYIHRNKQQMELCFELMAPLRAQRSKHSTKAINQTNLEQEKLETWLRRCKQRASKFTTAWSLDSLLIKPIQRLGKYPLFLSTMLECCSTEHKDYNDLQKAFKRSKHYLDCVNARYNQPINTP